jgi:O-antigen ligase
MRSIGLCLLLLGFGVAQVLIGGTRLLYSIPADVFVALAALLVVWPERRSGKSARPGCLLAALGLAAYIFARVQFSPVNYLARTDYFIIASSVIVYLLTALCFVEPRQRLLLLSGLLVLGIAHSFLGAIQFKEANQFMPFPAMQRMDKVWRASGFYISPNHFAGLVEVLALFALSLFVWGDFSGKRKIVTAYAGACCLAGLAISGSRGGYLSIIVGTLFFAAASLWACRIIYPKRLALLTVGIVLGLVALGGAVGTVMFQSVTLKKRFIEINDPENMRFLLWESALEQFHLNPIWGTGSGTFLYYGRMFRHPAVQNDPIHVHNDYLHLLAEFGVIGAAVFGVFLFWHLGSGFRSISRLAREAQERSETRSHELALLIGALCAVGAYLMHSVVDFNLHIPANALVMAFAFGIIANPGTGFIPAKPFANGIGVLARFAMVAAAMVILIRGLPLLPGEWFAEQARVALRDRRLEDARKFALRALEHEKQNPNIYYYAGEADREMVVQQIGPVDQLKDESLKMLQRGLEVFPLDSRTTLKLAHAYSDFGMFDEAEETLERAREIDPNSTLLYAYQGLVAQTKGDLEAAESYYRLALELDFLQENEIAKAGYAAVRDALAPLRAAVPALPPEILKELEEMKAEEKGDTMPPAEIDPALPADQ